jgi:hypothetical protein
VCTARGCAACTECCLTAIVCAQAKIPNHSLFFEKIYNMSETSGAVQEFVIAFNMFGLENTRMVRHTAPSALNIGL